MHQEIGGNQSLHDVTPSAPQCNTRRRSDGMQQPGQAVCIVRRSMRFERPSSDFQASSTVGRSSSRKRHGGLRREKSWKDLWRTTPRRDGRALTRRMRRGCRLGITPQSSVLFELRSRRSWMMRQRPPSKPNWNLMLTAGHGSRRHSVPSTLMTVHLTRVPLIHPRRALPTRLSNAVDRR